MKLNNTVTITMPDNSNLEFSELNPVWMDDPKRKIVMARFEHFFRPLIVWRGDDYDAAGDWTQAQAESKVLEVLGGDVQASLQALVIV